MDIDTIIILGLLASAFSRWLSILVKEEILDRKRRSKSALEKRNRLHRMKSLTKKL